VKNLKWIFLGIAVILFGISSVLLSGLQGVPTYHNGIYELLGIICPIVGLAAVIWGFFRKDDK